MGAQKKREPMRCCVVCRQRAAKRALLKLVLDAESQQFRYDPTGKAAGRGTYVCPREACLGQLEKGRASNKLGGKVTAELMKELRAASGSKEGQ